MEISRKKLVSLAFKAIAAAKEQGEKLSHNDEKHLLYAACTMDRVAANAWAIDSNCGCLVGTLMLDEGYSYDIASQGPRPEKGTLWAVGLEFDRMLREHLKKKYDLKSAAVNSQPVDVIDG